MIPDHEFDDLPDDDEKAFMVLEEQYKNVLLAQLKQADEQENTSEYYMSYMNHVLAAATALGIHAFSEWDTPTSSRFQYEYYYDFRRAVDAFVTTTKIKKSRRRRENSVALSPDDKVKIRDYIDNIKRLIDESNLSPEKKEAILKKVNELLAEVDKDRTTFEVIAGSVMRVAALLRDFESTGVSPYWKYFRMIFERVGEAKEEEERHLPRPSEQKRIEPPKRRLPPPKTDDPEIPF